MEKSVEGPGRRTGGAADEETFKRLIRSALRASSARLQKRPWGVNLIRTATRSTGETPAAPSSASISWRFVDALVISNYNRQQVARSPTLLLDPGRSSLMPANRKFAPAALVPKIGWPRLRISVSAGTRLSTAHE